MDQNKLKKYSTGDDSMDQKLWDLVNSWGISSDLDRFHEMLITVFKFASDKPSRADILQFSRTMKELRYANKVFAPYRNIKKITVFGSARTLPDSPEFHAAENFGRIMQESGFMIITGGGDGIMGAANKGATAERSFALNIELPFEQQANITMRNDPKLITFKYFFTRKVSFVKNSNAIVLFPGGYGTMDEGFEAMTLMQTGKSPIVPMLLIDAPEGNYWKTFDRYLREHLLGDKMVSPDDFYLYKCTNDIEKARKEIVNFYYNFHTYRYVGDMTVFRLQREVPPGALLRLQDDFQDILTEPNGMTCCHALPEEINEPELAQMPRLCVKFNRRHYGRLRQLIDRFNQF